MILVEFYFEQCFRDKLKVFCNEEDAVAVEKEELKTQWWVKGGSLASGLVRGR